MIKQSIELKRYLSLIEDTHLNVTLIIKRTKIVGDKESEPAYRFVEMEYVPALISKKIPERYYKECNGDISWLHRKGHISDDEKTVLEKNYIKNRMDED